MFVKDTACCWTPWDSREERKEMTEARVEPSAYLWTEIQTVTRLQRAPQSSQRCWPEPLPLPRLALALLMAPRFPVLIF